MPYNPTVEKILTLLKSNNCWLETFQHQEVLTSEEAARTRPGYTLHQGAKAMLMRYKNKDGTKQFAMLVYPADQKFDNDQVKKILEADNLRFASVEEIAEMTGGILPGAVPPFGNLFGLEVIADPSLFENEKIVFNAGDRRFSVAMKSADYRRLVNPRVEEIL